MSLNKPILIAVFCLLTLNANASEAPIIDLNKLSTTYQSNARTQFSENDVKSFVYQWFAAFDHQLEPGYFLNRIATPVDLEYPNSPISSEADFLHWYKGVMDNIIWNAHKIEKMTVRGDQEKGWTINYIVNWKAKDKASQQYDIMVHQDLKVIRIGDMLKLARLRAKVEQ